MHALPTVPARPRPAPTLLLLSVLLLVLAAVPAGAQRVVWVGGEPEADTLALWTAQALEGFRANRGDSAGGANYGAYERVGLIGRRLLRSQGRRDLLLAPAIRTTLDSLGFATEVAVDPAAPAFALLMVRDPVHPAAEAVGFLYWFREADLRLQGVLFRGGHRPRLLGQIHGFFPRACFNQRDAHPLLRGLQSSPCRAVGHFQFFCRGIEAPLFVDSLENIISSLAENHFAVFFNPDFMLDFHQLNPPCALSNFLIGKIITQCQSN